MSAKCLYIDLETRPIEAYVWGLWQQNVGLSQIIKPTSVISFAAKWRGEKRVAFHSVFHDGHEVMVQKAWDLLDQAQIVCHWNGDKFDVKHLNREFLEAGLTPPSPFKSLDLLKTSRSQFLFPSNKLQFVSTHLGLAGKEQTGGFDLWIKCMAGDEKAWARMRKYNKQDVVLLEQLHDRLLPYIKNHPHMGLLSGQEDESCQNCGGTSFQRRGFAYTPLGVYQQFRCNDCATWSRGKKAVGTADMRGSR